MVMQFYHQDHVWQTLLRNVITWNILFKKKLDNEWFPDLPVQGRQQRRKIAADAVIIKTLVNLQRTKWAPQATLRL